MPARRLIFAYLSSLLLHLVVLAGSDLINGLRRSPPRPTPAMLDATLRPLPVERHAEPLLKDTMAETEAVAAHPTPAQPASGLRRHQADAARRKLAEHVYYPEEAVARGLEGEVRLLLSLETDGTISDVQVAGGSGHAILDQAAQRAAWSLGRLAGMDRREIILPVLFRLRP